MNTRERLRLLCGFVAIVIAATAAYALLRHKRTELVDFKVYHVVAIRVLAAERLYRPEDGHYQYKYLPAFAVAISPLAFAPEEVEEPIWFALTTAMLVAFVWTSIRLLPDPRRSARWLACAIVVLTAKFWVKELAFGQTNL